MAIKTKSVLSLAIALALTACGGSDGGSSGGNNGGGSSTTATSGRAVDGYLSGSTVFCDANKNGILDSGEMSTTTDADGNFRFSGECASTIVVTGGKDTSTGYAFKGMLKGPTGSAYVTPLTSLLADTGLTQAQLLTALGLPAATDIANLDPMAAGNGELLQKTLAVQQLVQQTANLFGTLTNPAAVPALYSKVAAALSNALTDSPSTPLIGSDGKVNAALMSATVQKAVASVNADTSLPDVSLSDTDISMATAAIATQAERILSTPVASLIEVAKELQDPLNPPVVTDTAMKNYISPKDNSFKVNGAVYSLNDFADSNGITVSGLQTIGLEYSATGNPQIDKVVDIGMALEEAGDGKRILQVKVEQVQIVRDNTTGAVTVSLTPDTQVHVFAQDAAGTSFNTSIGDLSYNPITIVNNAVTVDYASLVSKIVNSSQNNSPFNAGQFTSIQGTFKVKFAISTNVNVRYEDGTPLPMTNMGIFNTSKGVEGPGISGQLTINTQRDELID